MDDYEQLRQWRKNIPDLHHGAYRRKWDKAMTGKSLRAALDSKCLDCTCWQQAEVKHCEHISCPLWPHRSYKQPGDSARLDRIRGYVGEMGAEDMPVRPYSMS